MRPDNARAIAQDALVWLAGRPEDLARFLDASGQDPAALRQAAKDPVFLGFLLEFILGSDALVLDFAAGHDLAPDAVARARGALPGGDAPHWT